MLTGYEEVYSKYKLNEVSWVKFDRAFAIEPAPVSPKLLFLIKIKYEIMRDFG